MLSSVNWAQSVSGAGISTGTFTYSDQASTRGQLLGAPSYLPPLTGIRALAALLVLGFHLEQQLPSGLFSFLPFLSHGDLGVDFFFILSGFIITHVYLASLASPSWGAIRVFFWHRFIRLYPVHIAVLAGLVVMVLVAGSAGNDLKSSAALGMARLILASHLAACLGCAISQWLESTVLVHQRGVVCVFDLPTVGPCAAQSARAPHCACNRRGCAGRYLATSHEFAQRLGAISGAGLWRICVRSSTLPCGHRRQSAPASKRRYTWHRCVRCISRRGFHGCSVFCAGLPSCPHHFGSSNVTGLPGANSR